MQYKTITLELLLELPELYEQLRSTKRLLPALDTYATELRTDHLQTMGTIAKQRPDSDPSQIASEALEIATEVLRNRLSSVLKKDEAEPLSLDAAMKSLRRATPPV